MSSSSRCITAKGCTQRHEWLIFLTAPTRTTSLLNTPIIQRPLILGNKRHDSYDPRSQSPARLNGEGPVHQVYPFLHAQ